VLSNYTKKDGLYSDTAASILEDDEGHLWMSTDQGIYGVSKKAIEDFDAGRLDRIPVTVHGKNEGLKSLECESRGFPSGWKTTDGRLWFTMFHGAAAVGPLKIDNPLPPPVLVEEILAGGRPATEEALSAISPDRRNLEIHYTAPSLRNSDKVRFKYQLVDYDDDWVDAGDRRVAYYTHVPPGTYQFRVIAANDSGVWNNEGARLSLTLIPYFHETLWFRSLAVLLLGALVYGAHRARAARAEKRAEELESLVRAKEEREQELKKSEARFRAFMDHTPAAVYLKDETGKHIYGNKTLLNMFGITLDRFVGTTTRDFFPAEVSKRVEAADQYVLENKKDMELPEYGENTQGRERWWKDYKFPIPLSESETLLGGIAVDVTSRKNAEMELQRIKDRIERENLYLRDEIQKSLSEFDEIVGQSHGLKEVLLKAQQVASTEATVLITGETGTGKELIARAIHRRSPRKVRSLITVNCAALPPTLIESELFGHEKGAFTGATERRIGRFELADRATIFLDEIGDLDMSLQTKLLRVLQEGELERVGATQTRKVDVRVIAATNQNLEQVIGEGRFREDLYYRLNVFPIEIPPLRERREDIPLLVWYFVGKKAGELRKTIDKIPAPLMEALQSYDWPGNIRELQNVIERAVITSSGDTLWIDTTIGQPTSGLEQHLASESDLPVAPVPPEGREKVTTSGQSLEDLERSHIVSVLTNCKWRVSGQGNAADRLGLNPSTLRHRMKKLGIEARRRKKEATPATAQTLKDKEREHILTVLDETGWKITGRGNAAERLGLKPSTLRFRMKKLGIERSS
jgi:PAS domain S-box-containing protein